MTAALQVERVDDLHFRAEPRAGRQRRVFGGQIMGQALAAAATSVPADRGVHLLHARFLRPADPASPVDYLLEPSADTAAFAHRRVSAVQNDVTVLDLTASFHRGESGPGHQLPAHRAGDPDELPTFNELAAAVDESTRQWWVRLQEWIPVEVRAPVVPGRWQPAPGQTLVPRQQVWMRTNDELGDEPSGHSCAAVYCSDLFLLTAAMVHHGLRHDDDGVLAVTLNHTMWFHEPFRVDDWWRYEQEGSWSGRGRVLCRGQMFDRSGRLVATAMQEGLLRVDEHGVRRGEQRLAG
jgi:acyl-CoA thioesterase-2